MNEIRQLQHLRKITKSYPNAWKQIDEFRSNRGKGEIPMWPDWCFAPMAVYFQIMHNSQGALNFDLAPDIDILSALSAWRTTQGIYRFDPDVYLSVKGSTIGKIPVDILYRMPEWCVYIETPDSEWMGKPMHGFYAHLEWDVISHRHGVQLLIDTDNELFGVPVHFVNGTLADSMNSLKDDAVQLSKALRLNGEDMSFFRNYCDYMSIAVAPLLSLLMYLCTDDAETVNPNDITGKPNKPSPKLTRRMGERIFPAKKPTIWETGFRTGNIIRQAIKTSEGKNGGKRPHVRCAHWHHFWKGSKTEPNKRHLIAKWLHPTLVAFNDVDELIPTIRNVN